MIKVRPSGAFTFSLLSVSRSVLYTLRDEAFLRRCPQLFVGGGGAARGGGVSLTFFHKAVQSRPGGFFSAA